MSIHTVLTHCKTTATASPLTDHIPSFSACVCVCVCVCVDKSTVSSSTINTNKVWRSQPRNPSGKQASLFE